MCAFLPNNTNRNVIPRWRDFNQTQKLGELASLAQRGVKVFNEVSLSKHDIKILSWNETKSIESAIDLINSAYIIDDFDNAKEAAEFLININKPLPASLEIISNKIIKGDEHNFDDVVQPVFSQLNDLITKLIRGLRAKLNLNPYNAINWIEIARLYLIIGKGKEAERCILVALQLSPNNRYVSRISSRFFIHVGDHLKAKKILKNNINFKADPWLMGADIAISTLQEKSSHNIKKGFEMIESRNFSSFDINELVSALATEEMFSGHNKNSRKLFNKSLINPNDNTVAQAVWASRKVGLIDLNQTIFDKTPNIFEAKAYSFYNENNWELTLASTLEWFIDQPFSRDPAIFGSFIASSTLDKYDTAIELCIYGLRATPNEFYLLNNLAFSYLMLKQIKNAQAVIDKMSPSTLNPRQMSIYLATKGLMHYAMGDKPGGKRFYDEAAGLADKNKDHQLKITAEFYHLRAKHLYDDDKSVLILLDKIQLELEKLEVPYLLTLLKKFKEKVLAGSQI